MNVTVNGKSVEFGGQSLQQLLVFLGLEAQGSAVAVGARVVPMQQWEQFLLEEGNQITIIRATQGG